MATFRGAGVVVVVDVVVTNGVVVVVTNGVVLVVDVVVGGPVPVVDVVVGGPVPVVDVVVGGPVPDVDVVVGAPVPDVDVVVGGAVPIVVVMFAITFADAFAFGVASGATGRPHEVIDGNNTPATAAARCSNCRRDKSSAGRGGIIPR